jgi:hypothetical protein
VPLLASISAEQIFRSSPCGWFSGNRNLAFSQVLDMKSAVFAQNFCSQLCRYLNGAQARQAVHFHRNYFSAAHFRLLLSVPHGLNMELDLQNLFGLHVCIAVYSLAETLQLFPPFPRIWAHIRGRYWPAKVLDDISL